MPPLQSTATAVLVALLMSSAPAPADAPEKILFTSMSADFTRIGIFTMNADGTQRATLTKQGLLEFDPALSPDGKHIVFVVFNMKENKGDIWVMNADGTGHKRLVENKPTVMVVTPVWSPDGKQIAYSRMKADGGPPGDSQEVLVMDADGKNEKSITKGLMPCWSPDGKQLLYTTFDKRGFEPRLWIMDADGRNAAQLMKPGMMGSFSPDGKRIAFMGADSTNPDQPPAIKTCDADGSNVVQASKVTAGFETAPRWTADGKRIIFCRMDLSKAGPPNKATILVMDADGANEKALTKGDAMDLLGGAGLFLMENMADARPPKP